MAAPGSIAAPGAVVRLGAGDVALLRKVNALFAEVFEDAASYASQPPSDDYLQSLLEDRRFIALAVLDGDEPVGALAAYELRKFEQPRSEIYIYDLAVAADHRRRGVATTLIEALRPIALDAGAWMIYVQADPGDDPAIALSTKMGTREDVLHFDIAPRP